MIERFNFYDVYGYLLPGLVLLAFATVPLSLATRSMPDLELSSAAALVVVGYLTGHILQLLAREVLPSKFADAKGIRRYPSDFLLDESDTTLRPEVKESLRRHVLQWFAIDVSSANARDEAFGLCRSACATGNVKSYGEQFQGLYALMRGISAAAIIAAANYLGWCLSVWVRGRWVALFWVLLFAVIVTLLFSYSKPYAYWIACAAALAVGGLSGARLGMSQTVVFILLGLAGVVVVLALRAIQAQEYYAKKFAETIYKDFVVFARLTELEARIQNEKSSE